jgi:hypothetical protein
MKNGPRNISLSTPTTQHLAPVVFHITIDPQKGMEIPDNAVKGIVTT